MSILTQLLRRIALWSLRIIAVLLVLWVAVCIEERWRGTRAWNQYCSAAEARGVKLSVSDLEPAGPDEENFAASPIIRSLFPEGSSGTQNPNWFAAMMLTRYSRPRNLASDDVDLASWSDHFARQLVIPKSTEIPTADVLQAVATVMPVLDQIRKAGERPNCRFPTKWEQGLGTTLPHMGFLMDAAVLFELEAAAHLAEGDSAAAYRSVQDMLRLYAALRSELSVSVGAMREGILRRVDTVVRQGLRANRWSEAELQKLSDDIGRIDWISDWGFAIASERIVMNATFDVLERESDHAVAKNPPVGSTIAWCGTPPAHYVTMRLIMAAYPRGWVYLSKVKLNEYFDEEISRIEAIKTGRSYRPTMEYLDELPRAEGGRVLLPQTMYYLSIYLLPPRGALARMYLRLAAHLESTRTACQLALYQQRNGAFPATLGELVPTYLPATPLDPVDGAPLRYKPTATGFDLWSIGIDRVDDGGKTSKARSSSYDDPDWVFRR